MTEEQKKLKDRAFHAMITLAVARSWCDGTKYPKLARECEAARMAVIDLIEDWAAHLGEPIVIKAEIKAQWLRELADQIEAEGEQ